MPKVSRKPSRKSSVDRDRCDWIALVAWYLLCGVDVSETPTRYDEPPRARRVDPKGQKPSTARTARPPRKEDPNLTAEARQLVLLLPPQEILRLANDPTPRIMFSHLRETPFAVNVATKLQEAAVDTRSSRLLDEELSSTAGPFEDKVLHYVLRRQPREVLREWVVPRRLFREWFIDDLMLPKRFGEKWDPSDPGMVEDLLSRLSIHLGEERPPIVKSFAKASTGLLDRADRSDPASVRDAINHLGRLLERELKVALFSWLVPFEEDLLETPPIVRALVDSIVAERALSGNAPPQGVEQWDVARAAGVIARASERLESSGRKGVRSVADDGNWTLSELTMLLQCLEDLQGIVKAKRRLSGSRAAELKQLLKRFEKEKLAQVRNEGSHHRSKTAMSLADLRAGRERLAEFIRFTAEETGLLPRFAAYAGHTQHAGFPAKIRFTDLATRRPVEFFIHKTPELNGRAIYALVDATENTVSLNPMIVDWTHWFPKPDPDPDIILV